MLPYGRQCLDDDDIQAVIEVLGQSAHPGAGRGRVRGASRRLPGGDAAAVSSGTAALELAWRWRCGARDEVITSPLTFAASASAAVRLGATPVFADVKKIR